MSECFICCTSQGKTNQEVIEEMFINKRTFGYPLVQLSCAYGCACSNNVAHNKCLLGITKCPTCRKFVNKPKLYVSSKYDYWFGYLFDKIKSCPKIIGQIKIYAAILIFISLGLAFACDKEIIVVEKNIKYMVVLGLLLLVQLVVGTILLMEDYFKKYWLYDEKTSQIKSL